MLEKSLGILFFLRKPSPMRPGPWLIFLRITVDGIPKELSLKRTWDTTKWQSKPGRAKGMGSEVKDLYEHLAFNIQRRIFFIPPYSTFNHH